MQNITYYHSPLGTLLIAAEEAHITGVWFEGQSYFAQTLDPQTEEVETPVLLEAKRWLDMYFSGRKPDCLPPLRPRGTAFQQEVWEILLTIAYGKTMTYGEIAVILAKKQGRAHMSAQAIGGAVGHNPISILIPCHRVVGKDGAMTGYAGGVNRKLALLQLEQGNHP